VITILVILVNCYVFFVVQGEDNLNYLAAQRFYFESGLADIELPRYQDYLKHDKRTASCRDALVPMDGETFCTDEDGFDSLPMEEQVELLQLLAAMQADGRFMRKLHQDRVVRSDEELYADWKDLRLEYEDALSTVVFIQYGFVPTDNRLMAAFTSLFLHGSLMHLVGNMVFFWLVGCVLELGCGWMAYLSLYLIAGICGAEAHYLANMQSSAPCIGASGAISGLMGAYSVLYGKRKIKIFYSLGFFFSVTRIAAIALLPFWIGNEILQYFLHGELSQVGYFAHIGGFVSGAVLGFVALRVCKIVDESAFDESPQERIACLLEQAYELTSKLDLNDARTLVQRVLAIDPENSKALNLLFTIDKMDPADPRFHETAVRLLSHLCRGSEGCGLHETYKEYCRLAKPPQFKPSLLHALSVIFSDQGFLQDAEQIVRFLLAKQPGDPKMPAAMLRVARSFLRTDTPANGLTMLRLIGQKYPQSHEATIARRLLDVAE